MGGLNLSSYASALAGGASGEGIIPGNAQGSQIVIKQSEGGHPGQLTEDQLKIIIDWINAGASEQ